jgi:hypothetical protein
MRGSELEGERKTYLRSQDKGHVTVLIKGEEKAK